MRRFILRYRGEGARPQDAVEKIRAIGGAAVLEDSDRMMLVEAPEQELRQALGSETDWSIAPEVTYDVADTRKKLRNPRQSRKRRSCAGGGSPACSTIVKR